MMNENEHATTQDNLVEIPLSDDEEQEHIEETDVEDEEQEHTEEADIEDEEQEHIEEADVEDEEQGALKPYEKKSTKRKIIEGASIGLSTFLLGGIGGAMTWSIMKIYRERVEKSKMEEKPEEDRTWLDKGIQQWNKPWNIEDLSITKFGRYIRGGSELAS